MSQAELAPRRKGRITLAVRVSLLPIITAFLLTGVTIAIVLYLSRPALIDQANQSMKTDAQTRVQLINAYFSERILDAETLVQVPSLQLYLATPPAQATTDLYTHSLYALQAGWVRDHRYVVWAIFNTKNQLRQFYPLNAQPQPHGQDLVPPDLANSVLSGKTFISPVYSNPSTQKAFVEIYAPITASALPIAGHPILGYMRATLNLDYIWDIVNSDKGIKNTGQAFILDQNGVYIASGNHSQLFTTDKTLANQPDTFEFKPAGLSENYQATSVAVSSVPWKYYVISPGSAVTSIADQELLYTLVVASVVLVLILLGSWLLGNFIARPILRSVERLRSSTGSLNTLATKQQSASAEQLWVIDSVQVGLQSVQYYADATRIAAHKLGEIGTELEQSWHQRKVESIKQGLRQMIGAAQYIEKATHYQSNSNQKLATAIKVTSQVNEQLAEGAISATEAASQLEQVVNELRQVVGK